MQETVTMADDEFEIDIYGDVDNQGDSRDDSNRSALDSTAVGVSGSGDYGSNSHEMQTGQDPKNPGNNDSNRSQDAKPPQGIKRKSDSDDRPVDTGATTALLVSELNWWHSDDDIRGWCWDAHCEDELINITFSEHKVNAKSKGYVPLRSRYIGRVRGLSLMRY